MGYMCLHTVFKADGHQAECHLCGAISEVDISHYGPTDTNGKRIDGDINPQYKYGTFEYKFNNMGNYPKHPSFVFCFDIGTSAVMTGFFAQAIQSLKQCLDYFPN